MSWLSCWNSVNRNNLSGNKLFLETDLKPGIVIFPHIMLCILGFNICRSLVFISFGMHERPRCSRFPQVLWYFHNLLHFRLCHQSDNCCSAVWRSTAVRTQPQLHGFRKAKSKHTVKTSLQSEDRLIWYVRSV